ncbi:MAG: rRNA pseudouridine synthase, partial [Deltaproteobacteria bacterium]|nr:rRNA pseudouridine synthase [Deltaproteobacteria bacterium]
RDGRVAVDGVTVTEMGLKVESKCQRITVDRKPIIRVPKKVYILLNKPKGYVTTMSDPQGRPIVTSLLKNIKQRLFPVGRLDLDTEGALLMTNDGDLAQRITHPRFEVKKTYLAVVKGKISRQKLQNLEKGIELDGQITWPAELAVSKSNSVSTTIRITIHEGRKRQVRRMFSAVGHHVMHLKRLAYGNLQLGSLQSGKYRFLKPGDLQQILSRKFPRS